MTLDLKFYKSAGVPVTAAVHRILLEANRARDRKAWRLAADRYREALDRDGGLAHIWIQYGHALKEDEDTAGAEGAYLRASQLAPGTAEPLLHLGHLAKGRGDMADAARRYIAALRLEPNNPDALGELTQLAGRFGPVAPAELLSLMTPLIGDLPALEPDGSDAAGAVATAEASLAALQATLREGGGDGAALGKLDSAAALLAEAIGAARARMSEVEAEDGPRLAFDVSDLIAYFRDSRLPTGIQRVQIEVVMNALAGPHRSRVRVCCFSQDRDVWVALAPHAFVALCRLCLGGGERSAVEWLGALARLSLTLSAAEVLEFAPGTVLVNLGTSWWIPNYFLALRQAKAAGCRYIPFVHDVIPLLAPQCCAKALTQEFVGWILGVFEHADAFLANSQCTKRDLLAAARSLGYELDPDRVSVVRLDGDFRRGEGAATPGAAVLARHGLEPGRYVLCVSTLEARKNHVLAFDAWLELIRSKGLKAVPKLVCVGKRGWLCEALFERLDAHEELRKRVVILSGLPDAEVGALYDGCLFTLYPSTFEGWGLPVTESLCHGKVALISDGSALPEAGGRFASYFEAGRLPSLVAALEPLIFDGGHRRGREALIAAEFRPRTWREIADDVAAAALRPDLGPTGSETEGDRPAAAVIGAYLPLQRNREARLRPGMRSAEVFRTGGGWWGQDDFGCWTKAQGARLSLRLLQPHGALRLYLHLKGPPQEETRFEIDVDGEEGLVSGALYADEDRWIAVPIAPASAPEPVHRLSVRADNPLDLAAVTGGQDPRRVGPGVRGFYLCAEDDVAARLALMEAVTFRDLSPIEAKGPRRRPTPPIDRPTPPPLEAVAAWEARAMTLAGV